MEQSSLRHRLLTGAFLLCVFLLGLNKIDDPDAWMHLSLGRMVWQHGSASFPEAYVFPNAGAVYYYFSWLFGLVYYLSFRALDLYGVVLLKALSVTLAFLILFRDSLRPYRNHVISAVALTITLLMVRHRFVERPDTMLMVFLPLSIYCLNAFLYDGKKYLYALPVAHLLWANMHTSIILMAAPFAAFIAGGLLQRLLGPRIKIFDATPSYARILTMAAVGAASAAAAFVTPSLFSALGTSAYGQFSSGPGVLSSSWWKQEIMELQPPRWEVNKWPFLMTAAVLLSFAANWRRLSLIHLLLTLPFMVMQFTAYRFIFLFGVVSGPVLARNVSGIIASSAPWTGRLASRPAMAAALCLVALAAGLTIGQVGPFGDGTKVLGFGMHTHNGPMTMPEGALRYMDSRGITGKLFNVFPYGGYVSWRDYPGRTVFVDPRGPLSEKLLEKMLVAHSRPAVFEELDRQYGFDACLLWYYAPPRELVDANYRTDLGLAHPGWTLVYWDDVSLVYLKQGGRYDAVLRRDAYRFIKPTNGTYGLRFGINDPAFREGVTAELERNIRETGSARASTYLGFIHNEARRFSQAVDAYTRALASPHAARAEIYGGLAFAYYNLKRNDMSIVYAEKALALGEGSGVLYTLALNRMAQGDNDKARRALERAIDLDATQLYLYPMLISVYGDLGMRQDAERLRKDYARMKARLEAEGHFREGVRAQTQGDHRTAIREYELALSLEPRNAVALSNLGYAYFDNGEQDRALQSQQRALEINPGYANAHYGLALLYRARGDRDAARRHWREYLRIEPAGRYARRAEAELKAADDGPAR